MDAFNRCSAPDQLEKHASCFAIDVEFRRDTGGVTQAREDMLASTRTCACGKREGMADFVMVWRNQAGTWRITRVLSFGHRPNKGAAD
jgi:hypothetical protein